MAPVFPGGGGGDVSRAPARVVEYKRPATAPNPKAGYQPVQLPELQHEAPQYEVLTRSRPIMPSPIKRLRDTEEMPQQIRRHRADRKQLSPMSPIRPGTSGSLPRAAPGRLPVSRQSSRHAVEERRGSGGGAAPASLLLHRRPRASVGFGGSCDDDEDVARGGGALIGQLKSALAAPVEEEVDDQEQPDEEANESAAKESRAEEKSSAQTASSFMIKAQEGGPSRQSSAAAPGLSPQGAEQQVSSFSQTADSTDWDEMSEPDDQSDNDQKELSQLVCECGNLFMDDARFCRMCGKPRPVQATASMDPHVDAAEQGHHHGHSHNSEITTRAAANAKLLSKRMALKSRAEDRRRRIRYATKQKLTKARKAGALAQELDIQRREFNALPETEASAMRQVFDRFDLDGSDLLEGSEIVEALRELGLRGSNTAEKREIMRICHDAAPQQGIEMEIRGKSKGDSSEEETFSSSSAFVTAEQRKEDICAIDFLTFALKVVPRVRLKLQDLQGNELMRQFFLFDKNGSGRLTPVQCLEIARVLGLDQRYMDQEFGQAGNKNTYHTEGVTCEEFQSIVIRSREQLQRVVKKRERAIQAEMGVDEKVFAECRQDIVNLYDIFIRYRNSSDGKLPNDQIMAILREFGLQPKTPYEREELKQAVGAMQEEASGDHLTFIELLELAQEVREYYQDRSRSLQQCRFERYDKDGTGFLSVGEISHLLWDVGCAPHSRREQEEIAQLIQVVDQDGNGEIDFTEFQVLSQRIDEKLKSMRYEAEIEHAMTVGFSEAQLRDLRWVFDSLDADGSEKLSAFEVRAGLAKMDKKVSMHAFETAFNALDEDGSGELDFLEFLDFMQLMRDGEGIFAEDSQKLPSRAKFFESGLLRRVLENFRLSKSYLNSLSKDELVDIFCQFFEVDSNANLNVEMNVNNIGDLFKIAKKKAEESATAAT